MSRPFIFYTTFLGSNMHIHSLAVTKNKIKISLAKKKNMHIHSIIINGFSIDIP